MTIKHPLGTMPLATGSLSPATDDRDRHPLDGSGHRGRVCQDDVGVQADQLLRERSKAIGVIAGPTKVHPRLRSSVQPKPASACVNAEMRAFATGSFLSTGMSTPMRRHCAFVSSRPIKIALPSCDLESHSRVGGNPLNSTGPRASVL